MLIILEELINPNNSWAPEEGDLIGRAESCQIRIRDSKVSSVHAKVEKDSQGQFVLVDQDSHNGLYLGGRKVKRITLLPGLEFRMGTTQLIVRAPAAPNSPPTAATEGPPVTPKDPSEQGTRSIIKDLPDEIADVFAYQDSLDKNLSPQTQSPELDVPPLDIKDLSWDLQLPIFLEEFANATNRLVEGQPESIANEVQIPPAFVPHIRLTFDQGIQYGTHWDLYFSPTHIGKLSHDKTLQDPLAPDDLALIIADPIGQPIIQSLCGNSLKINGKSFTSCPLRDGDVMSFGNTTIKVRFL